LHEIARISLIYLPPTPSTSQTLSRPIKNYKNP
jgi:hypothetical protein